MISLVSVNVGAPREVSLENGRKLLTAFLREPVDRKIFLDYTGLEGDQVADPVNHGGRDKAVCAYPSDHFPYWEGALSRQMEPGAFGENLTLQGLTEDRVHVGDIFRVGEAEIQCSQPRQPCHKITKIYGFPKMAGKIQEQGYSGFYFRVLKQGWMQAGMEIHPVQSDPAGISIDDINRLMYRDKNNVEEIERLLAHPALSQSFAQFFQKRLANRSS
ncbi:MAG: MOSC domain-containing protein [Nitrospinaceae bacterium]|nr:MOSC domain-containing protein [Nitrospinaceae bacterium]NIR57873.1 MOSC domain-containing protein [Nitrospinaceae bacterium]NIS88332.1 MOSC domain-containing protein [Nitrospinaceae bacterium]NIT85210.1 MOSC domain-containing protein [Nitrospinaceae bacterium]NIU47360.1 MOSC domain-containing protein [Nitrospinaceae bacterium]